MTPTEDKLSEEETIKRRESALKRMLATPHRPHSKPLTKRKQKKLVKKVLKKFGS